MLSGFNTNVRHRSLLFHVQSEDSGRSHPHIITHLYHRGTIIASEKSSYADRLDAADLTAVVKELMEKQHKAFLKRLVGGQFDALIRERLGPQAFGEAAPAAAAPSPSDSQTQVPVAELADTDAATVRDPGPRAAAESGGSERPLDEVILDYLVESARQRKRRSK